MSDRMLRYIIRAKNSERENVLIVRFPPIASIFTFGYHADIPEGWIDCDGRYLLVDDCPELYAVLGDGFCPKKISRSATVWERVKLWFGLSVNLMVDNPEYREGMFRIPYFRPKGKQELEEQFKNCP